MGIAAPSNAVSTPDETRIIFDDEFNDAIHVIDTATDEVVGSFSVGFDPHDIVGIDAATATAFVDGAFVKVDLSNPASVPSLTNLAVLSGRPLIAAGPNRREIVAVQRTADEEPNSFRPRIAVVDTTTGIIKADEVLETPFTGSATTSVAVAPDGTRVVLAIDTKVYVLRPVAGIFTP